MRFGITIVFNGIHHFGHKNFEETMLGAFDHWVIVHGAAKNTGSTSWCKGVQDRYFGEDGMSADGTWGYLCRLQQENLEKLTIEHVEDMNKDEMVNHAVKVLSEQCHGKISDTSFLWEVDVDEVWDPKDFLRAEADLVENNGKTGMFLCNMWLGKGLLAKGEWGEGNKLPYRRLWNWNGELFKSHEPPVLEGGNGKEVLLPQKFDHYSYFFEKDVLFKNDYYGGHENIYEKWIGLQDSHNKFPQPIGNLISGPWGRTNTEIVRISRE